MSKRILLVDYDSRSLTHHREVLEGAGFQVSTCGDGLAAIDKFKTLAPDLILLSAMLPKMHGFEVCSKIRKLPGGEKIPVVIITDVYKGKRYRVDAIHKYGATEYIEQPIEDANLVRVLQSLVQQNGAKGKATEVASEFDVERTVAFNRDELLSKLSKEQAAMMNVQQAPAAKPVAEKKDVVEKLIDDDVSKKLEESLAGLNLGFSKPKPKPKATESKIEVPKAAPQTAKRPSEPPAAPRPAEAPPTLILKKQEPAAGSTFTAEDLFTDIIESVERELEAGKLQMNAVQPEKVTPPPSATPAKPFAEESAESIGAVVDNSPIFSALDSIEPQTEPTSEADAFVDEGDLEPIAEEGTHFGQYLLLSKIATGGMAELFKAKRKGVEGFEKILAIKRILPHMSTNEEFVTMFVDEAKLAAQLTHQNICQIFDLGKIQDSYYITMEYVPGKDLRGILKAARAQGKTVPAELAILIVSKICSALDYAHRKKDANTQPLNLVHRDVSPQNILISYEGDVKLVDFGIAKATNKVHATQDGALRGKLQYMSPEQAWGRSVDRRADIFSLGLVLYEMLTGQSNFYQDSDTEVAVLDKVREARLIPVRQVNSKIPAELERILNKALKKAPEDRYQSAAEFQRDLDSLFYSEGYSATSASLASFVRSLFPEESGGREAGTRETLMLDKEVLNAAQAALKVEPEKKITAPKTEILSMPPLEKAELATTMIEPAKVEHAEPSEAKSLKEVLAIKPRPEAPVLSLSEPELEKRNWLKVAAIVIGLAVAVGLISYYLFRPNVSQTGKEQPAIQQQQKPLAATVAPEVKAPAEPAQATAPPVQIQTPEENKKAEEDLKAKKAEELKKEEERKAAQEQEEKKKAEEIAKQEEKPAEEVAKVEEAKSEQATDSAGTAAPQLEEAALSAPVPEQNQLQPQQPPVEEKKPEPEPVVQQQTPEPAPANPAPSEPVVNEGDLVELTPGVVKPVITHRVDPEYPRVAMGQKLEGTVILSVLVSEKGDAEQVKVLRGAARSEAFSQAAVQAVKRWKFQPAVKAGKRVKVWVTYPIVFKLQ